MTANPGKCPVDHSSLHRKADENCPVEHSAKSIWTDLFQQTPPPPSSSSPLSTNREVSSIPRGSDGNWVYPSEAQFFAAMARKNHNPQASDMKTIIPIHNAVNERAWGEIMKWEAGKGGERCGGPKLVTFMGKPGQRSIKARWRMLLGYAPPFDRHDWVVDRCGIRTRYIIDFYTGKSPASSPSSPSFFLDVRPALDNWEGVTMRFSRFWEKYFSNTSKELPPARSVQS